MKKFILFLCFAFIGLIAGAKPDNDAGKKLPPVCFVVSDQGQPVTQAVQTAANDTAPEVANYIENSFINYDRVYMATLKDEGRLNYDRVYMATLKDEGRQRCFKNYGFIKLFNLCKPPAYIATQVKNRNKYFKPDRQNSNYGYPLTADIR